MTDHRVHTSEDFQQVVAEMHGMSFPFTVSLRKGGKRSLSQNALLHKLYGEIAEHFGDRTPHDVKGEAHYAYALPIRLRDEKFAWVWERSGANLPAEKQRALLASGVLGVSSGMTTKELKEYLDQIYIAYTQAGVRLTTPEDRA